MQVVAKAGFTVKLKCMLCLFMCWTWNTENFADTHNLGSVVGSKESLAEVA